MRPLITELVEHVDVAEWTEDAAHKPGLSDRLLHAIESRAYDALRTHDAGYGARDLAEKVVCPSHSLLARGYGMCDLLGGF